MSVVDYERAWVRLMAYVTTRPQHGRDGLMREMARIAGECQSPEGELARLLRLYGVEVARAQSFSTGRSESGDLGDGFDSSSDAELAGHHRPNGGHDGTSHAAGNGRRIV